MARPLITDQKDIKYAQALLARAKSVEELRMAQAVLLPHCQGLGFAQAARLTGVGRRTISRLRQRLHLKRVGKYDGDKRGGRRRQNMSLEEEGRFLAQWRERAARGQVKSACQMRQALARQLGRRVSESYVYRLLARNNWSKHAPDTRQLKTSAQKRQGRRKNSRKIWLPCPSPGKPKAAS